MNTGHVDYLSDLLKEEAGTDRFRKTDCLQFGTPQLDYVGVSVLVSGITSSKLQNVMETALGSKGFQAEWDPNETVAQNIRGISPDLVEELMVGEIREVLQVI
jgi:hypothetical protein